MVDAMACVTVQSGVQRNASVFSRKREKKTLGLQSGVVPTVLSIVPHGVAATAVRICSTASVMRMYVYVFLEEHQTDMKCPKLNKFNRINFNGETGPSILLLSNMQCVCIHRGTPNINEMVET